MEKQLKLKTRREIMILGTKLGKTNIAAWASKEDDDGDEDRVVDLHVDVPNEKKTAVGIDIRAATAWEEAEKSKYIARFKREEIKIQAWENHQKAMAEAELKKMEVMVERRRIHGHDRLQSKLADVRHKAMEKHAVVESKRNLQAARVSQKADFMRRTGQTPSSSLSPQCSCWNFCCR
ncbi:hypothetical protein ZOSMA_53G00930 [Zostera marina]|uniref:Remorin C-terminal domain-containing protein n=1 Tax=Zostera marina TaxID=29655 RepID=A0A0K9NXA4_ZOSMR|nr:hypothetical protein ZOSMA_53G00930 [Zostera marina]